MSTRPQSQRPDFVEVDVAQARALEADGAVLIDVREADEWIAGHAEAARHIPLGSLDPGALPRDVTFVLVCRSGARSGRATRALAAAGLPAVNLRGGMLAWQVEGQPVVLADGRPGVVL